MPRARRETRGPGTHLGAGDLIVDEDDRRETPPPSAADERLEDLAAQLGLGLPPFAGPLDAFDLGKDRGPDDPIYLGGDLHAVHPDTVERRPPTRRDPSLDAAMVMVDDREHGCASVVAVQGIWCLALSGGLRDSTPYFSLWDGEGRMRAWLLLPPARLMMGLGHFWLPRIEEPTES